MAILLLDNRWLALSIIPQMVVPFNVSMYLIAYSWVVVMLPRILVTLK